MAVAQVELSGKARRDLKRLGPGPDRKAVIDALTVGLAAVPQAENLDIKALEGATPYLRLRVGTTASSTARSIPWRLPRSHGGVVCPRPGPATS